MMHRVPALLTLAMGMLLVACASTPVHFHTLVPPAGTWGPAVPTAAYDIAVLPVAIPAEVDRPQMVVRVGSGSVVVLDGERWIAPLGDQMHTVLSDVITTRLGARDVFGLAGDGHRPLYRIKVQVQRFESVPGQYTLLWADWSVTRKGDSARSLQCTSHLREAIAPGDAAMVDGQQRGLVALGGRIAHAVRALAQQGNAAMCPSSGPSAGNPEHS